MIPTKRSLSRLSIVAVLFLSLIGLGVLMTGEPASKHANGKTKHQVGLVEDWSTRHLVFSNPGTYEQVKNDPAAYSRWLDTQYNTRYIMQQMKRGSWAANPSGLSDTNIPAIKLIGGPPGLHGGGPLRPRPVPEPQTLRRDWGMSLLASGTVGDGMFPAKYTFDVNATPDCKNDYVAFNTGLTGTGATPATATVTIRTDPGTSTWGDTRTVTVGGTQYTFHASPLSAVNQVLRVSGGTATQDEQRTAQNLYAVINGNSAECYSGGCLYTGQTANASVTASNTGPGTPSNVVNLTAITPGTAGNFTLSTNYSTGILVSSVTSGVNGQPSIIAFDELYSTQGGNCLGDASKGTGPQVKWAYYMSTGPGTVVTSPVLSGDGTMIAYVESSSSNHAILRILKWKPGATATVQGTLTGPSLPDTIMSAGTTWNTTNCPAANSCIESITFSNSAVDTTSPPFYDYTQGNDAIYVGDGSGVLHKFVGVFDGTPAECTSSNASTTGCGSSTYHWPITVHSSYALTGPVFDPTSETIFVGDASGQLSYVMEVGSTTGACGSGNPPCLGTPTQSLGGAIVDAPLVDGVAHTVFAFEGTDTTNSGTAYQFNTALATSSKKSASIGYYTSGYSYSYIHAGAFDNAYFVSANSTGHLFVCGKDRGGSRYDSPAIHRITITNGVMNTSSDGYYTLTSASGEGCSAVTEIYNTATSTDRIFFSVGNLSNTPSTCSSSGIGCLISLNLTALGTSWPPTSTQWSSNAAGVVTPAGPTNPTTSTYEAGTSGIVVDNVASTTTYPQASSLYFSFTSNAATGATCNSSTGVGCAVKLTQSGLN